MALPISINYNNQENFLANYAKVSIDENGLELIPVETPLSWTEDFSSDENFNYDDTKSKFESGSVVSILNKPLPNAVAWATYKSNINLKYGSIDKTGTAVGNASIINQKLNIPDANSAVTYDPSNFSDVLGEGSINFKFTLNSFALGYLYTLQYGSNELSIRLDSNNVIRLTVKSDDGFQNAMIIGSLDLQLEQKYELEVNWSATNSFFNFILDGDLKKQEPATINRTVPVSGMFVGNYSNLTAGAVADIEDLIVSNQAVHNSSYTPPTSIPEFNYLENKINLPTRTYEGTGQVQAYGQIDLVDSGSPRLIVNGLYWNSVEWVDSDGSYDQANTLTDYNDNADLLTPDDVQTVSIVFPDSNSQTTVSNLIFNYTGQDFAPYSVIYLQNPFGILDIGEFEEIVYLNGGQSKRVLIIQKVGYWFDGNAWVPSNFTPAQANTIEEINANIDKLTNDYNVAFRYAVILEPGPEESPRLIKDQFEITYKNPDTFEPQKCLVFGYIREIIGPISDDITDLKVTVENEKIFFSDDHLMIPSSEDAQLVNDDVAFKYDFAWSLYHSLEAGVNYKFRVSYKENGVGKSFLIKEAAVPKALDSNIKDLVKV